MRKQTILTAYTWGAIAVLSAVAQPPQAPTAKFARTVECGCSLGGVCTCGPSCDCSVPISHETVTLQPPQAPPARSLSQSLPYPFLDYRTGYYRALRDGKPLMVWVGYRCPTAAKLVPGAYHVSLDDINGDREPRVLVNVDDGSGSGFRRVGTVHAPDCSANNLKACLPAAYGAQPMVVQPMAADALMMWDAPMNGPRGGRLMSRRGGRVRQGGGGGCSS